MRTSEALDALAPALAKAQGQIEGATKGKVNPAFKSRYADLAAVWDACREALSTNGLSIIQCPGEIVDNRVPITTRLLHSSGQWIEETLPVPLGKADAHGLGSAITYGRRFALAAIVGIAPEDDDGNAAVGKGETKSEGKPEPIISDDQYHELATLIEQTGTDTKQFCDYYRVGSVNRLPVSRFEHARTTLTGRLAKKVAA